MQEVPDVLLHLELLTFAPAKPMAMDSMAMSHGGMAMTDGSMAMSVSRWVAQCRSCCAHT